LEWGGLVYYGGFMNRDLSDLYFFTLILYDLNGIINNLVKLYKTPSNDDLYVNFSIHSGYFFCFNKIKNESIGLELESLYSKGSAIMASLNGDSDKELRRSIKKALPFYRNTYLKAVCFWVRAIKMSKHEDAFIGKDISFIKKLCSNTRDGEINRDLLIFVGGAIDEHLKCSTL